MLGEAVRHRFLPFPNQFPFQGAIGAERGEREATDSLNSKRKT